VTGPGASRDAVLRRYRDDGPAALLGTFGSALPMSEVALTTFAVLPLAVVLVVMRAHGHAAVLGLALAWFAMLSGAAAGRPHVGRFDWAAPALLHAVEYAVVLRLASMRGTGAAAFAFLAAVVYHHYDIVYRVHLLPVDLPWWRRLTAGGWLGRLAVVYVLDTVGGFRLGLYVTAGVVGALALAGTARVWREVAAA
jgi:hypothetical protein